MVNNLKKGGKNKNSQKIKKSGSREKREEILIVKNSLKN